MSPNFVVKPVSIELQIGIVQPIGDIMGIVDEFAHRKRSFERLTVENAAFARCLRAIIGIAVQIDHISRFVAPIPAGVNKHVLTSGIDVAIGVPVVNYVVSPAVAVVTDARVVENDVVEQRTVSAGHDNDLVAEQRPDNKYSKSYVVTGFQYDAMVSRSTRQGGRALFTERERDVITGTADVTDNYRWSIESRARSRIDKLELDIEAIAEHNQELSEMLREAFEPLMDE